MESNKRVAAVKIRWILVAWIGFWLTVTGVHLLNADAFEVALLIYALAFLIVFVGLIIYKLDKEDGFVWEF